MAIIYVIIYILILTFVFISLKTNHKRQTVSYILILFILFLYSTFRDGNAFLDYGSYVHALKENISLGEPTFIIITELIREFFNSEPIILFGIYSFISLLLKGIAIQHLTTLPLLSLLILSSDFFILQELTQMRAAVATSLLLLAIPSLYHRNKKYFIYCTSATLFHFSGLLMFPLWLISSKSIKPLFWIILFTICYTLAILHLDFISLLKFIPYQPIQEKVLAYLTFQESGEYQANIFSLLFLAKCIITLYLLFHLSIIKHRTKYSCILMKIMFISLCSLLLFSQNMAFGLRVSEFYGIVSIILFPLIYFTIRPKIVGLTIVAFISSVLLYIRIFSQQLIII